MDKSPTIPPRKQKYSTAHQHTSEHEIRDFGEKMRFKSLLLTAALGLTISATCDFAHADHMRWHRYADGSMLLDTDSNGQRLIMPEEYNAALLLADFHYSEVNPDSFEGTKDETTEKLKGQISFDIAPRRILSDVELHNWADVENTKTIKTWWFYDLLLITYRNNERRAQAASSQDPDRAQQELAQKRETARMPTPSAALIKRLDSHGIHYTDKAYTNNGSYDWRFDIGDDHDFNFPVKAGSSEQAIIKAAFDATVGYPDIIQNGVHTTPPERHRYLIH
jgi:hypothetical protein